MKNPYRLLEKNLGYRFRRKAHLVTALTHPSYRYECEGDHEDNQRLEFLGDAALGLVAAAHFFDTCPELREGDLTKLRSKISSRTALARIGTTLELGAHLRLGRGEEKSGGAHRASNLADAVESVLGAAYLDGGLKAVEKIFAALFLPFLKEVGPETGAENPKGALQELSQKRWKTGPRYRLVDESGPPHARVFTVEVSIEERVLGRGEGRNKRTAEMHAAEMALAALRQAES